MACFSGKYKHEEGFRGFICDEIDTVAENEHFSIAYIGEIYRSNGILTTACLVLEEIEKNGLRFFQEAEGAFACGIYNKQDATIYLIRDKMGIKPLFYSVEEEGIYWSSSLKKLAEIRKEKKEIDQEALSQFFQLTYIPAPKTIYKGISKIMPATCLQITRAGIKEKKYWNIQDQICSIDVSDYETCKKTLRDKLFASAERRLSDAKEYGALLSGGFDSTIITGIVSKLSSKPIRTFTVGSNDKMLDESRLAEIVAKKNHTVHHTLLLDWDAIQEEIPDLLSTLDEPYADSSLLASYAVSKCAKESTDVIFTGDGGDEVFAGYNKYLVTYYAERYNKVPRILRKGIVEPIVNSLPKDSYKVQGIRKLIRSAGMSELDRRKDLMCLGFKPEILSKIKRDGQVDNIKIVDEVFSSWPGLDAQTMAQYIDYNIVLEGDMFPKGYYTSKSTGITIRSPILDEDIVSYSFAMPSDYRIKGKQRKVVFKEAFSDLIPEELYKETKHGFGVPVYQWLREGLREELLDDANEEFIREQGIFNGDATREIINLHVSGKENYYSPLWAFFVFQNWYKRNMM